MADPAEEPLMVQVRHEARHADRIGEEVDVDNVSLLLEKNLRHPGIFVWLLTFSAGISGLLFGYDTGVISATLVSINSSLGHPLTTLDKSLITSTTSLFALLISPISGVLADTLGRKRVVLLADLAFVMGAVIQAVSSTVSGMIAGRSIVGLAVGAGSFVAPLYISELAPAPFRGRLVVVNVLFITLGQVVAYVVGWGFVQWGDQTTGWRWMVGLGALPAAVQCCIMLGMPETPRWLVQRERNIKAREVLSKVYGGGIEVQRMVDGVLAGIQTEVSEENESRMKRMHSPASAGGESWLSESRDTWAELFRIGGNRRALAIACLLQGLQQLCGFNSLMYFSATIFTLLDFASPTMTALSVALTNFIFTCAALVLIDRVGRRRILLLSVPIMAVGLLLCSVGFLFIHMPTNESGASSSTLSSRAEDDALSTNTAPLVVLASVMLFVAAYALGIGNISWMQSELFPLNVRSLGSGISTTMNWSANFVVGLTFLPMMEFLTPAFTFVIYAGVCVVGWLFILRIYPETKGLSLEEMGALLANGWGVKKSKRGREMGSHAII